MSQQVPPYPYGAPQQPGGYGPPGPTGPVGPPPPSPASAGTNTMAILSIVFAFLFSPLGIVFGIVGRRQTARARQNGRGLATAGLVLSVVFLVLGLVAVVYATFLATALVGSIPTTSSPAVSAPASPDSSVPDPGGPVVTGPVGSATVGVADGDSGPRCPPRTSPRRSPRRPGPSTSSAPGTCPRRSTPRRCAPRRSTRSPRSCGRPSRPSTAPRPRSTSPARASAVFPPAWDKRSRAGCRTSVRRWASRPTERRR